MNAHSKEIDETSTSILRNEDKEETRSSIEREEELWSLVRDFANKKRSLRSITLTELKRWEKLLRNKTPEEQRLMQRMYSEIKIEKFPDEPELVQYRDMEEVFVTGNQFDHFNYIGLDPSEFSVVDIAQLRDFRKDVNALYREGRYEEAYPILLELAKRGFKDAQSRLAYILFTGANDVPKSNLRALGWLGVSASGDTEPTLRKLYRRIIKRVPSRARPIAEEVVAKYIETYGFPEHISCSTNHPFSEGRVKRTYCEFKLESIVRACLPFDCWANQVNR